MYGGYINGPFMMPNMSYVPMSRAMGPAARGLGGSLRSLLGLAPRAGSAAGGINWSSLLNNTSKTIGVVKEAIPIVKEVGPMMNNMRSMFKIASVFKDETDTSNGIKKPSVNYTSTDSNSNNIINTNTYQNKPNFFL